VSQKRELSRAYKERRQRGGIYTITNIRSGKYLLCRTSDMASAHNRFQFAVTTGSTVDPRLRKDWEEYGPAAFTLTVLEELEQDMVLTISSSSSPFFFTGFSRLWGVVYESVYLWFHSENRPPVF
jgi:hypothetical protein